ncbi:universal stress protein [Streptomyces swartbergensis]|uniref:Universal stress protein n=1 Tax=Streptomyces swartbergensis TaxID=487165 RepID=A0A243SAF0_9ACTN|nr:universal stress protein [Streptomyces swartbergensis]OUD04632.1 universal stress protein [Streptomyces swartbergensis]
MTIIVAVPDSIEGARALSAAATEAQQLGTDLVVCNLGLRPLDTASVDTDVKLTVVDRKGKDDRDPVDAVLDEITHRGAIRLVIGVRRRTPVGKAILGSVSQRLLLRSPVPVLAVKVDE